MLHPPQSAVRVLAAFAAPLLLTGALAAIGPAGASASACVAWTGAQPPNPGVINILNGVATLSPCNAWAVGDYQPVGPTPPQTLIEHWNGRKWKQMPSPDPAGPASDNELDGVVAISASNAWAVGAYASGTAGKALIEHWNGKTWRQVPSPNPSSSQNALTSVAAISARNVWAVGFSYNGTFNQTFIEHWNGTAWRHIKSPNASGGDVLSSVAATSSRNAWAVGYSNGDERVLVLHWNGRAWKRARTPNVRAGRLSSIAATSFHNAWAVGDPHLVLHWNGRTWRHIKIPKLGADSRLKGVTAISRRNTWAVGYFETPNNGFRISMLHWNGKAWRRVASPDPSSTLDLLDAVAATSSTNIWAVGAYNGSDEQQALALHCC
jgi:hypothetical protein